MMKTRSSGRNRGGFQFTGRDARILKLIYDLDKPDTSHITKLLFRPSGRNKQGEPVPQPGSYQTTSAQAIRRLEHLTRAGYIKHERPPLVSGMPNLPYAYSLTPNGYEELVVICGVTDLPRPKKLVSTRSWHYPHFKRCLDILVDALLNAEMAAIQVSRWHHMRTLREAYQEYQADLYLLLEVGGRRLNLFPEIDMGSEGKDQFQTRIRAMMSFIKSSYYRTNFPEPDNTRFPVITVSEERMQNLIRWTREAGGSSRIWFTASAVGPENLFTDRIWTIPALSEPHTLVD